jgi:hypothetical protein
MSTDHYLRAVELDPIPGASVPRGRHIAGGELRALFEHLAQDPRPIALNAKAINRFAAHIEEIVEEALKSEIDLGQIVKRSHE